MPSITPTTGVSALTGEPSIPAIAQVPEAKAPVPSITVKSLSFGLLGVIIISLYAGFNDSVLQLPPLIGNHFPVGPMALIMLLAFAWNPLVGRVLPRLALGPGELVVALAMMLISSWIPASGLYRYFQRELIVPWLVESQHPTWAANHTLSYLPAQLFPLRHDRLDPHYDTVYGSFPQGLPRGDAPLGLFDAPYADWLSPMIWWAPLIICVAATMLAVSRLVHRQWSHHEQLSYPLAQVAAALLARTPGQLMGDIVHSRLFWWGCLPVFGIHLINTLSCYWPSQVPSIPLGWWSHDDLVTLYPSLNHAIIPIQTGHLYFTIIGMSYFIATDVSLSMGLSALAITLLSVRWYLGTGGMMSGDDGDCLRAGGYCAYFLLLLYTGRGYYLRIFAHAVRPTSGTSDAEDRGAVWAARAVIAAFAATVVLLVAGFALDWFIAIIYAASLVIFFLVFTRIICETGIPFLQANFDTGTMITNLIGIPAVGPGPLVMILYLGNVLNPDPRECLMPYAATSLKLGDIIGVRLWGMLGVAFLAMLMALVVGFAAWTYNLYNTGAGSDGWAFGTLPALAIDHATNGIATLRDHGQFERADATHGLGKVLLIGENAGHGRALGWMGGGLLAVLALAALRFRIPGWPLHPVLILVMNVHPLNLTWASFLIGWGVKSLIVRLGGGGNYHLLKPLFIGLIVGEIAAVSLVMVAGVLHYAIFHTLPPSPDILPR